MNINFSKNVFISTFKSISLVIFSYIQFKKISRSKALSHEALPFFPRIYEKFFNRILGIPSDFKLIAEGSELCAYSKYNSQTERFSGLNLSSLAFFPPKSRTTFVVIDRKVAVTLLLLESKYLQFIIKSEKSSSDIFHLKQSLNVLVEAIEDVQKAESQNHAPQFSQQALNRIQYFTNSGTQDISIAFANCVVLQKSVKLEGCEKIANPLRPHQVSLLSNPKLNQRCLVFYLDNVSFETLDEIKDDKRYQS